MGIKHPRKLAEKKFREFGGVRTGNGPFGDRWTFPDGWALVIPEGATPGHVAHLISEAKERYGTRSGKYFAWREKDAPRLDFDRLTASAHAKERLTLMTEQAGITAHDMLHALQLPERVAFDQKYGSWVWVRGVLAVPVAVADDGSAVITSVLWSGRDLYDQYPREQAG